jgi:UDPglucose 6-dehydrogenase
MERFKNSGINVIVYEPNINEDEIAGFQIIKDFGYFKKTSDVIVTNRYSTDLKDVSEKVYSRDLFTRD